MARPPQHLHLTRKDHICTWVHPNGSRGLYAQQRGQFVQAQITGYSYRKRRFICHNWAHLAFDIAGIVRHWGAGWKLRGAPTLRMQLSGDNLNARGIIEARSRSAK